MEAKAIAKEVRIVPRKSRLVIDLVRGKSVIEADTILKNINKEAARAIRKVLTSATANAENRVLKRMKFGSRGHVDPIKKRTSHITIIVSEKN